MRSPPTREAKRGRNGGDNEVLVTTNGGDTWDPLDDGIAVYGSYDAVHFVNPDHGWIAGYEGRLMRTVDGVAIVLSTTSGGATWTDQLGGAYPRGFSLNAIAPVNANVAGAVGNFGLILRTGNGGQP